MVKLSFFSLLFGLCVFNGLAQSFETELTNAVKEEPKMDIRFDSRHSFVNQTGVKVFGFKMGLQFDNKLSMGLGYNQLWLPLEKTKVINNEELKLELAYYNFSPYVEYVFYRDERWELTIPVQVGFGSSYYSVKRENNKNKINQRFVISYEPAITFQYRFHTYFGAGLGVGYRLMLKHNPELDEKFTSPVYIFKTNIYFEDLWKDLKNKI